MHSVGPQMVMVAGLQWAGVNFLVIPWMVSLICRNELAYVNSVSLWMVPASKCLKIGHLSLSVPSFVRC